MGRAYRGPSEAQANADALARRSAPYTEASGASFRVAWDFHHRQPSDLREAAFMLRKAYADEVPTKLHEGYDSIGEGGTPKMTARAEGYIMGSGEATDAPKAKCICAKRGLWRTERDTLVSAKEADVARPILEERTRAGDFSPVSIDGTIWTAKGLSHAADCPKNPANAPIISYYHTPFRATLARWMRGDEQSRFRALIVQHVTLGQMNPVPATILEGVPRWCAKVVAWDALSSFHRDMSDMKIDSARVQEGAVA